MSEDAAEMGPHEGNPAHPMRERRVACGLSRNELARQVHKTGVTISNIEGGHLIPSRELGQLIADKLQVDVETLGFWDASRRLPTPAGESSAQVLLSDDELREVLAAHGYGPGGLTAHPLTVERLRRSWTVGELARRSKVKFERITDIEKWKRRGALPVLGTLAGTMGLDVQDLCPIGYAEGLPVDRCRVLHAAGVPVAQVVASSGSDVQQSTRPGKHVVRGQSRPHAERPAHDIGVAPGAVEPRGPLPPTDGVVVRPKAERGLSGTRVPIDVLTAAYREQGWSQAQLAVLAGLSELSVWRLLSGKETVLDSTVARVASALRVGTGKPGPGTGQGPLPVGYWYMDAQVVVDIPPVPGAFSEPVAARWPRALWESAAGGPWAAYIAASLVGFRAGREEARAEAMKVPLPYVRPGNPAVYLRRALPRPPGAAELERDAERLRAMVHSPVGRGLPVGGVRVAAEELGRRHGQLTGWNETHIRRARQAVLNRGRSA